MAETNCDIVLQEFRDKVERLVDVQTKEHREAIFFIFKDGSTSDIFKGDHTSISLSKDQERAIQRQGEVMSSVHSHPSGFDPSTIDIMTGLMTDQEFMCIVTPAITPQGEDDFILTCIDMSNLDSLQSERLVRAMRRSSVGLTDLGRMIRKETNLTRFEITGCRSQPVRSRQKL